LIVLGHFCELQNFIEENHQIRKDIIGVTTDLKFFIHKYFGEVRDKTLIDHWYRILDIFFSIQDL